MSPASSSETRSPSSHPSAELDPPPVLLHLDHHMLLLSIQESLAILSEIRQLLHPGPNLSAALDQCQLRLSYFLLHFPAPEWDKGLALRLHRESLGRLADRLVVSQATAHNLTHFLNRPR